MKKTPAALVALTLLGASLLSGCTTPTTAADVNSTIITTKQVDQICAEMPKMDGGITEYCSQVVLSWLIRGEVADAQAKDEHKPVSDAELEAVEAANQGLKAVRANETTKPFALAIEKYIAVNGRHASSRQADPLEPTGPMQLAAQRYVNSVNPRYGTWTQDRLGVSPINDLATAYLKQK